ncbi:MAG: hypothetical protein ACKOET_18855 [Verrucomicrobiota bacterium]
MNSSLPLVARLSAAVLAGLLVARAEAGSPLDLKAFESEARQTRLIELPDVLARAIRQLRADSRGPGATELLGVALRVHPTSSTKLLSTAIRACPDAAVALTDAAVRAQPENAAALVSVAMDASPAHRDALSALLTEGTPAGGRVGAGTVSPTSAKAVGLGETKAKKPSPPGLGGDKPPGQGGPRPSGKKN